MAGDKTAKGPVASQRVQKPRQSRARGLRTSTGCLTCRQRRVKCDEGRPVCGRCIKASRECAFSTHEPGNGIHSGKEPRVVAHERHADSVPDDSVVDPIEPSENSETSNNGTSASVGGQVAEIYGDGDTFQVLPDLSEDIGQVVGIPSTTQDPFLHHGMVASGTPLADFETSSFTFSSALSPGTAPFQWYDLLAQDALDNFDKHSFLNHDTQWEFDPESLSRRPGVFQAGRENLNSNFLESEIAVGSGNHNSIEQDSTRADDRSDQPWNTHEPIVLETEEASYLQHYIKEVAPIIDLFDPAKHFGNIVPHLALRNIGVMKALLAVAARYMSLSTVNTRDKTTSTPGTTTGLGDTQKSHKQSATQYYYETLGYLARAMQLPSYTRSSEILATAIMISTYEMFDGSRDEWDRHLRGAFWIQRSQDNDGESRGIREAVWWAWVRQDIWAAIREQRGTLTIWRPKKPLANLNSDELATRVVYLLAKAISYASKEAAASQDIGKRLEEGNLLLRTLEDWFAALPPSYRPIPTPSAGDSDEVFGSIWIHPPSHAAAIQSYCLAKILISLNKPSAGSISAYHECQNILRDASKMICGLAKAPHADDPASAFVSFQCLFGAGQCLRTAIQQEAFVEILQMSMANCRFSPKSLVDDLRAVWKEYT